MYEIGDYVVKPVNGVCKIADILHLDMTGTDKNKLYYLLIPLEDKSGKIYVPMDKADSGIRKIMTKEAALEFISRIPEMKEIWVDNEKLREQRYKEAVKSCKPEALIGLIKITYLRNKEKVAQGKKTTVVDERYFKLAENNLYAELGCALHKDKSEVYQLIVDSINRC